MLMKHKFLLIGILPLLLGLAACDNNEEELKKLAAQLDEQAALLENQDKAISEQNQKIATLQEQLKQSQEAAQLVHGYKAVDLGLSVRWATCNVGAANPEEPGYYLQWGAIEEQEFYNYPLVRFWDDDYSEWTKYCYSDNKTTLESDDDAASRVMGSPWRMPTIGEVQQLVDSCTWEYAVIGETEGAVVTGPNGNSIFIPAAGYKVDDSDVSELNECAYYWTASLDGESSARTFFFGIRLDPEAEVETKIISDYYSSYDERYYGQSVRAVCAY